MGGTVCAFEGDMCHWRQLPLPLWVGQGGAGWASEAGHRGSCGASPEQVGGGAHPAGACGLPGWVSRGLGDQALASLPGPEPLTHTEVSPWLWALASPQLTGPPCPAQAGVPGGRSEVRVMVAPVP